MSSSALRKPHKIIAGGLLRMHAADRVSSMLVALVLVIGTAVVVMTAIYFSRLKADAPKTGGRGVGRGKDCWTW